jgi:hypothetical protein
LKNAISYLQKKITFLPVLLCACIVFYLVLRIVSCNFTIDEVASYQQFVGNSISDIFISKSVDKNWAPNNHILNTLCMKLAVFLFGPKDWAMRIHSVLAFIVCFYYCFSITQIITTNKNRQLFYVILCLCNPYVLDFFSLARGYALCLSFLMAAFYYLLLYIERHTTKDIRNLSIAMSLAMLSNFSILYYYALLTPILLCTMFLHHQNIEFKKQFFIVITFTILTALICYTPLHTSMQSKYLAGGTSSFYKDGLLFYVYQFIHKSPIINNNFVHSSGAPITQLFGNFFINAWGILSVIALYFSYKAKDLHFKKLLLFISITIALAIVFIILFYGKQIPLPRGRTILIYTLPFYLSVCFAFEIIIQKVQHMKIVLVSLVFVLLFHFVSCMNLGNPFEWWDTGEAKATLAYLSTIKKEQPIEIGAENSQYISLVFYAETKYKNEFSITYKDEKNQESFPYLVYPDWKTNLIDSQYHLLTKIGSSCIFELEK